MSEVGANRKIAVILVADVVGYSKHMERDENATLQSYSECEKILNELLEKRQGSIFNTAGDSVLAEFTSAVNAVEFAVEFQNKIIERNKSENVPAYLEFRIGINMGDVVSREGNLLGDGVNIAARLEALSQPNGVCTSKSIYELVAPKTKMTFNDLGIQKVKQNSFHAYDVLVNSEQKRKLNKSPALNLTAFITVGLTAVLLAAFSSYLFFSQKPTTTQTQFQDTSKPIILVQPIKAAGLSDSQKGFAAGITESMIGTFSSYNGIRVLSSSASFHSSETKMTDAAIRDEYGVQFVVRGSMQVMGDNARLNLEIADIKSGIVAGTKKRDFKLQDIFTVQDEMAKEILASLQLDLGVGKDMVSWAKQFDNLDDFTKSLNWIREWRKYTPEGYKNSKVILDGLKIRYPENHPPLTVLEAWQIHQKLRFKLSQDEDKDLERLKFILDRVTTENPDFPDGFNARALIGLLNLNASCEDALSDIKTAEKNGTTQETLLIGSGVYDRCGFPEEGITRLKELLKIVPNDPGWFQTGLLITRIYQANDGNGAQEIKQIIGDKINAKDMDPRVLAIYSIFKFEKGDKREAREFFTRAVENGFRKDRLSFKTKPELTTRTHEIINQIEALLTD